VRDASGFDRPDCDPRLLTASIERSLERLRTDHLDVVQRHSCPADARRRGEVVEALRRAREAGKTRHLGYSGDGEAAREAVTCGVFDTVQTSVNIADQEAIDLTLPLARARGMGVIAKRPVANVAWRHAARPADPYIQAYWERLRRLDDDFLGQSLGEAVGTALRFTLGGEGVHTAIVGSARPGRWRENAAHLAAGSLPAEAFAAIRARWRARARADWRGEE
jgi:aryl-alcohol dehydrogenase-like predicted oxidoreductase